MQPENAKSKSKIQPAAEQIIVHPDFSREAVYLAKTLELLQQCLTAELGKLDQTHQSLVEAREELQDNLPASPNDADKRADTTQALNILRAQAAAYQAIQYKIGQYQRMEPAPYFGRVDFTETGYPLESIYIGRGTLIDPSGGRIWVYDWRAPVSSLYYRYGLGKASYTAPVGEIRGDVTLKRQYDIRNGELAYFIDTDINIDDQALRYALSQNASPEMKAIVETIQKEQDQIIRDMDSELLMVQGSAGSGKTSVALHRVAYLMYRGLTSRLEAHHIIIISPNALFSQYISQVLPDLGEENIASLTFDTIFTGLDIGRAVETRAGQAETLLSNSDPGLAALERDILAFKASSAFCTLLDRLVWHYEHKLLTFPDFYYNGRYIAQSRELKEELLRDRVSIPLTKRLAQIQERLLEKIHNAKKERIPQLEEFVSNFPDHQLEVRPFARLLSVKRSASLVRAAQQITEINSLSIYKLLFEDPALFRRLSKDLTLPDNIGEILEASRQKLYANTLSHADGAALTYLKLKLDGPQVFPDIQQVIVDEAQDYGPLHFALLDRWFPNARYTILGDICQSVERPAAETHFEDIRKVLHKKKAASVVLRQSYRSSFEISRFSQRFLDHPETVEPFERHEDAAEITGFPDREAMDRALTESIRKYREAGCGSIAIICKTMAEAHGLYQRLRGRFALRLVTEDTPNIGSGTMILPVYLAKGLEFDAVLVYGADAGAYSTPDDRRLLYIACTRALHHLSLYYAGIKSQFIE